MRRVASWWVALCWLAGASALPARAQEVRSLEEVRAQGSLRGTDLDGEWAVPRLGNGLQNIPALQRRFDHLLTAMGETNLRELRAWIGREVTLQHGAAAASQVLTEWDGYVLRLQQDESMPVQDASNPVLTRKQSAAPHALLMPDPGMGLEQQQALQKQRVALWGAMAAERLHAEDLARWAWAQRLAEARVQMLTLAGTQREAWLAQRFSGNELLRARTLLGLPP